jgi:hypothetical protein
VIAADLAGPAMDAFLDRLLEHRRAPSPRTLAALTTAARRAGVDPGRWRGDQVS